MKTYIHPRQKKEKEKKKPITKSKNKKPNKNWSSRLELLNTPTDSLYRGKTPTYECPGYDTKHSDDEVLGSAGYPFIDIVIDIVLWSTTEW